MKKYAHKSFLCDIEIAEQDGYILTEIEEIPVKKGEIVLTDLNGKSMIVTESMFEDNYVEVEYYNKEKESTFDQDAIANGYATMTDWMTSNEEDSNYINDFQQKVKERNNKNI